MDEENKKFTLAGREYHEGDYISLDGTTGNIYGEAIPTVPASTEGGYFGRIMELSDKYRQLEVRTTPTLPVTPSRLWPSARRASACAVPSTCSSIPTVSLPSARDLL